MGTIRSALALIDDDELIRSAWTMVARTRGHALHCFSTYEEFVSADLDRGVTVYVDFRLADGVNGIDVAKKLISSGYTKVYLSTGLPIQGELPKGILGVVGKEYPKLPGF